MGLNHSPKLVTSGLVVCVDPGNTKSYPGTGTSMVDLATRTRTVAVVGSPTFTKPYFTMTSDATYISMANTGLSHGTSDFTYSLWLRFASVDSLDTFIENGSWTDTLLFRGEGNTVTCYSEGVYYGAFSWTRSTNVWYNITFVRATSSLSFYVNGVPTGTAFSFGANISLAVANLWLMRSQHTSGQNTSGDVSTFHVYTKALTAAEIKQNFYALRGRFGV